MTQPAAGKGDGVSRSYDPYGNGYGHGYSAGRSLAWWQSREQQRLPTKVLLSDPDEIRSAGMVEWARGAKQFVSHRGATFQARFLAGFSQGYIADVLRNGLPPMHRRCAVCRHASEAVHAYQPEPARDLSSGRWECDDLVACHARVYELRLRRKRLFGEHVNVL